MSQSVWPAQQYVREVTELKADDNDLRGNFNVNRDYIL